MINILQSYISKFLVDINRNNDDIIKVETEYFSPEGDVYVLDRRTVSPSVLQTTQSLSELQPEVSTVYPFKIVVPRDNDGAAVVLVPGTKTFPTASQNYYAPAYFERYERLVVDLIDTQFTELQSTQIV